MTPREHQAARKQNILSCYSNSDQCIVKSEEVAIPAAAEAEGEKKEEETEENK